MTRDQIKQMVLDIIGEVDYDVAKSFDPETAEEPEYAETELEKIIDVAERHINANSKAPKTKKKKP